MLEKSIDVLPVLTLKICSAHAWVAWVANVEGHDAERQKLQEQHKLERIQLGNKEWLHSRQMYSGRLVEKITYIDYS